MTLGVYVFALLLALSSLGHAGPILPCAPDTLQNYINNLAFEGCAIGSATFSTFFLSTLSTGATEIDPASLLVNPISDPLSPGFEFRVDRTAAAGELLQSRFGYILTLESAAPVTAHLAMTGSFATGDGVTTVVKSLCPGGEFIVAPDFCESTDSFDSLPIETLIVFDIGIEASLSERIALQPLAKLGVITDIVVDGGPSGSAGIGSAINRFTIIPEPGTFWRIPALLACVWLLSRRKSQ